MTHRPIDDCPHCEGKGGRAEEHCPAHGVQASLTREDAFYRKQDQLERHGFCPAHPTEVKGRCPRCLAEARECLQIHYGVHVASA